MDASGSLYHLLPNHDNPMTENAQHDETEPRQCSLRGCTLTVTGDSNNKMCDACRGRHSLYATTKRAKQKLEKASGTEATSTDTPVSEASSHPPSTPQQLEWVVTTREQCQEKLTHARQLLPAEPSHKDSPFVNSWQATVGGTEEHGSTTYSMFTLHFPSSSSSSLANALSFPVNGNSFQEVITSSSGEETAISEEMKPQGGGATTSSLRETSQTTPAAADNRSTSQATTEGPSTDMRVCTVKGCKALIPDSHEFKMCPPCRERYRIYGNTKRTKWKHEREAFEREMASLYAMEDEKRKAQGLGPLSDNLDELRAWELSVIDEEIPLPEEVASSSTSPDSDLGTPSGATMPTITTAASTPSTATSSSTDTEGLHPVAGVIDLHHTVSTYPLNGSNVVDVAPLHPARMCTVSYCDKILPDSYRYKRCELHRIQNRHHSTLKRGRARNKKVVVPEYSGVATDITRERQTGEGSSSSGGVEMTVKAQAKATTVIFDLNHTIPNSAANPTEADPVENTLSKGLPAPVKKQRGPKHLCGMTGCHNLLIPDQKWRTCDICRGTERDRRITVREQLKAAENVYWKDVAQTMSTARKLEQSNVVANGNRSTGLSNYAASSPTGRVEKDSNSLMDVDGETNMDAEGEVDDSENITGDMEKNGVKQSPQMEPEGDGESTNDTAPATDEEAQSESSTTEGRVLVWRTKKPEPSTHVWPSGFSKFRVAIPTPPMPTMEQPTKFNDVRSFRAYTPTTAPSAIGRIIARNPQLGIEAFSEILIAESSKVNAAPISHMKIKPISPKNTPTPTIPVSTPFVYKTPKKNQNHAPTDSEIKLPASKGKRKAASYAPMSNTHTIIPVPLAPMSQPFSASYGLPHSYPYYPYYVPSYPMLPYPYAPISAPNDRTASSSKAAMIMGPPITAPPFYPHSYPPQPYEYAPGMHGMPFLPPRYAAPPGPGPGTYTQSYTEQPLFSGIPPPAPGPIQGYNTLTPPTVLSDLPLPAPTRCLSPSLGPIRVDVKRDGNFNHYHYEVEESASAALEKRRKRVKQESESNQSQITVPAVQVTSPTNASLTTNPTSSDESMIQPVAIHTVQDATRTDVNRVIDRGMEPSGVSNVARSATHRCFSRTCQRSLPTDIVGNICDKCKLKFKKHRVKAKQKFKLEPRKFLIDQNPSEKSHRMQ